MAFTLTVTNMGFAALVNAQHTGTAPVAIAAFGLSEAALAPAPALTSLPGEVKRLATLSGDQVDDGTIHLIVRDDSADSYTMRSVGLYLADGTLFAIYGQEEPIIAKAAASMMLLAIDARFANIDAALLSFGDTNFLNPPATTERLGVVELATPAEAQAGMDAERAVPPAALLAAVTAWLNSRFGIGNSGIWHPGNDGAGSGLDADLWRGQTPAQFVDSQITAALVLARLGFTPVNKAGDSMAGPLALPGAPTANLHAATKKYVDDLVAGAGIGFTPVNRAGDSMTGRLTLSDAPLNIMHAANKGYVDDQVAAAALLARLMTVDGAGSGLDADLWRGQTPAQFLDSFVTAALILGRIGYTPVNRAGDTMGGFLTLNAAPSATMHAANKGYVDNAVAGAALGFTPVNRAGDTMTGRLTLSGAPTSNLHAATKQYVDQLVTAAALLAKLVTVDGAGSGLDADTLDGYHAGDFDRIASRSYAATGYRVYADGFKEMWGSAYVPAGGTTNVSFPNGGFSSWVNLSLGVSIRASGGTQDNVGWTTKNNSGFTLRNVEGISQQVEWSARGV
ncbi:hypothetical protein H0274_01675 [Altererythrobacter sp. CC-YST694]|uniref:phage tail protein n=1 Tax=Altererythrobacter sp. CC-YST694 TaxID=2755038 RepID=UPI001D006B3B|nr:phage tail protein [Altererythrobacter sp. CC-YST694]MCB5423954.1 hypothetical protein [Altererythrobacter sp. CC-YST694]